MQQDAYNRQQKGEGGRSAYNEGEYEERQEWEKRKDVRFGLGIAALKQVVSQFIIEEEVSDRSVEHLLLEGFYLAAAGLLRFAHWFKL